MTTPTVVGHGVHSGARAAVRLHRADGPLRFRTPAGEVEARLERVVATERSTVLGHGAARVATVEHLLAALRVHGFWSGVVVEIDAEEVPILDGSAAPWSPAVEALGAPPATPAPWVPLRAWSWREGSTSVALTPGPERLTVAVEFPHPAIGAQRWSGVPARYPELLDARTFAVADDLDALRARGLLRGADAGSGILFTSEGPHVPPRGADEPVRHKALDALGDLALLGRPIAAHVSIQRGSHQAHVSAMRQLLTTLPHPAAERA